MYRKFPVLILLAAAGIALVSCATPPAPGETLSAITPYGLAFDAKGRIWISMREGYLIWIDDMSGSGLRRFGSPGGGGMQFLHAMDIASSCAWMTWTGPAGSSSGCKPQPASA